MWIDVLLSAGVDVEVCRVEEASLTVEAPKRRPLRKRSSNGARKDGSRAKRYDHENGEEGTDEEDGGGDADEFKYESGEEGKKTGGWARPDSEPAVINLISSDIEESGTKRRRV